MICKNQVYVYWCNIDKLTYNNSEISLSQLFGNVEHMNYVHQKDAVRHITGLLLAEWAWFKIHEKDPLMADWTLGTIRQKEGEKPYFEEDSKIHFNISHSGNLVICAIAKCEVGIDVEEILDSVAEEMKLICDEEEIQWMLQGDVRCNSYRLWTWKESYLKCTGEGMSGLENMPSMIEHGELKNQYQECYIKSLEIMDTYATTLCVKGIEPKFCIEEIDGELLKRLKLWK